MPSILDKLRGVLKCASNSTIDLATALSDAQRAEAEAVQAVEAQSATVAAGFLDPDSKREKDRAELERLRLAASDAEAIRAELERRHAAALSADEDARRQAVYAAAKAKGDKAALDLAKAYPKLCQGLTAVLRDLAEAQLAVAAANAALPDGAEPLSDPEMAARGVPGLPREVISEEVVEAWSRLDMDTPVDPAFADRIYSLNKNGEPTGWGRGQDELEPCWRLRRFRKTTFRARTNGEWATPLAAGIRLPAVRGTGMLWGNAHLVHDPALAASMAGEGEPGRVLARCAEFEAAAAVRPVNAERPVEVEWTLLADVVPLPVVQPAADTTHRPLTPRAAPVRFGSSPMNLPSPGARSGARR